MEILYAVATSSEVAWCTDLKQHVYAVPSFQRLRVYRAHSASVTSISISPFPLPPPEISTILNGQPIATDASNPPSQAQHQGLHHTPSNSLYIATSSIDGNVCIASLVDQKDVLLRNFGRPVQSVALSPRYKNDRTYISGGLAGSLVRTVGGRIGTSSNSTLAGGSAQASSWLGSFGLGLTGNNGTDTVLHSGEGAISTIKWSLSGRLIVWVNEEGIKFMRSNLDLDSSESELAWTRIGHIDRPNLPGWEEMASVWKARVEWVDENTIERELDPNAPSMENGHGNKPGVEKLVIGWGGTIWIINVFPGRLEPGKKIGETKVVEIATKLVILSRSRFTRKLMALILGSAWIVSFLAFRYIPRVSFLCFRILYLTIEMESPRRSRLDLVVGSATGRMVCSQSCGSSTSTP